MPFNRADELASVDAEPLDEAALPPLSEEVSAQVRSLETVRVSLQAEAKAYALQLAELAALGWRAQRAGGSARRSLPMELAGSWQISQWTAERWLSEAEWFTAVLPLSLQLLGEGRLLKHQAIAVRQELEACTPEIASKVEAEVPPDGAGLCPTDLRRELKRVRLRLEREQQTAEQADAAEAEKVGRRRTCSPASPRSPWPAWPPTTGGAARPASAADGPGCATRPRCCSTPTPWTGPSRLRGR